MRSFLLICTLLITMGSQAAQRVVFETNLGAFTVELYPKKAPITVKNFLTYVKDGSYQGSIFHRVIPGFMAQGGGFDAKMNRLSTHAPIQNESSNLLKNAKATIAMARTNQPNSATSQFFINYADNAFLDYQKQGGQGRQGYAVFGRVVNGFAVVEKMASIKTHRIHRMADVPTKTIMIQKVRLETAK